MKFTNPFAVNPDIRSPLGPVLKICLVVIFLIILFFRNRFISITNEFLDLIISVFLTTASILIVYISIVELMDFYEKKSSINKEKHTLCKKSYDIPAKDVLTLLDKNDCMDITILHDTNIIHIGVTSDNNVGDSSFFDKKYYIGSDLYDTREQFVNRAKHFYIENNLRIIEIDDLSPLEYSEINRIFKSNSIL